MRDTAHLSMVEDAAYRRLLDAYYMTGKLSANAEILLRVCRAVTPDEQAAVRKVAAEFFEERDGFLYLEKVEQVIAKSRAVSVKRSDAGKRGAEKTNRNRTALASANAGANAPASVTANDVAIAAPNPQPQVNTIPTTSGAAAPATDPIFGPCLQFLTGKGCAEKGARSFLGLMRKQHGDAAVVEAVERAEREDISEPIAWLRSCLDANGRQPGRRAPTSENFDSRNYGQGGKLL